MKKKRIHVAVAMGGDPAKPVLILDGVEGFPKPVCGGYDLTFDNVRQLTGVLRRALRRAEAVKNWWPKEQKRFRKLNNGMNLRPKKG